MDGIPLKKPFARQGVMKLATVSGASRTASSSSTVPLSVSMKARGEKRGATVACHSALSTG